MILLSISAQKNVAEIEIRIPKSAAPTKDLWLLEASRLIWEIWTKMGWQTYSEKFIQPEDWRNPLQGEDKDSIMSIIERLLKIIEVAFPETGEAFESVIESIAKVSDEIHEGDFKLEQCIEVEEFRKLVLRILFLGVLRGLDTKSAEEMEYLSDPIYKKFYYDKNYMREKEDFVFRKTKESYISTYTIDTSLSIPFRSVQLNHDDFSV